MFIISENRPPAAHKEKTINNNMNLWRREQVQRIQKIYDACINASLFENQTYRGGKKLIYLYSSKYNLSYCKVPKVGCSFWTQALTVLNDGSGVADKVFGMARKLVHQLTPGRVKFDSDLMRKSRTVLISRDPYTRLYSAFVDKILLPSQSSKSLYEGAICGNEINFDKFLQDISKAAHEGKTVNHHWAPIMSLCDPCNVTPYALVKQESFSTDVEFVLQEIRIASDEFEVIHDALHDHRIEATVPGIIQTVLFKKPKCKTKLDVAMELWLSFQIQGYIRDDIPFPDKSMNLDESVKWEFLTDLVLNTIKENALTTEESKQQRHRYLVNAYKSIDKKTLEDIQNVFKQDFIVFDYSFEPPSNRAKV